MKYPPRPLDQSAGECNRGNLRAVLTQRFRQTLDGIGREPVHQPISFFSRAFRNLDEFFRFFELGKKAIKRFVHARAETSGLCRIFFISNIEIGGRNRKKSRNSVTNSAIEPSSVAQSQIVA